jgi:biopolymer transport protein ExbD
MASRFHKSRQRRAEREPLTAHGNLNLVPLVDILTSIVFFSLLTYTGAAMAMLTAFDLSLPPVVVTGEGPTKPAEDRQLNLLLAVKIHGDSLRVEHSEQGGFMQEIGTITDQSLEQFQTLMAQIRRQYPDNNDVLVVPDDGTSYDEIIKVLDRIRLANFENISLGSRARATQVASAAGGR